MAHSKKTASPIITRSEVTAGGADLSTSRLSSSVASSDVVLELSSTAMINRYARGSGVVVGVVVGVLVGVAVFIGVGGRSGCVAAGSSQSWLLLCGGAAAAIGAEFGF